MLRLVRSYGTRGYKPSSFQKSFPKKPMKAWERDGEDKDTWFRKKYAHVHVKQKQFIERQEQLKIERQQKLERKQEFKLQRPHREQLPFGNPLVEFVYGTSAVLSALKSDRRTTYNRVLLQGSAAGDEEIIELARARGITVENCDKQQLNRLSNNNPHNGVVLETRPIVLDLVRELTAVSDGTFSLLGDGEAEISRVSGNPFGVFVDEVTDPYNLGAIIRSAYFLGADFVLVTGKNCAPLSPVVAKAASGALELVKIYSVNNVHHLIESSQRNGWAFVTSSAGASDSKQIPVDELSGLLSENPCVLVLGSEGKGVRKSVVDRSNFLVSVKSRNGESDARDTALVDSLNVSVAGSLLIHRFLS